MFYGHLARHTKSHLISHLPALIDSEKAKYTDNLPLVGPKQIDISSALGGVMAVARQTLPQYAIDCGHKEKITEGSDNLNDYLYDGQITWLVSANDPVSAEEIARRHAAVLEEFCRTHYFLHQYSETGLFTVTGFEWYDCELTGAMNLNPEGAPDGELWCAGGTIDLAWRVSEAGPDQHGS